MVSILLALVIGAAWEWVTDRLEEREYRQGLITEFEEGRRELAFDITAREAILDRTTRMLDVGMDPVGSIPQDSAEAYSSALIDFRYFTPTHPVLEDIIAGGRLELLRSDRLRRSLLRYIQERDRIHVVESRERDFVADALEPYLLENLPLGIPPSPGDPVSWGPATDAGTLTNLLRRPAFRTLLVLRHDRTDIALRFSRGLDRSIDSVLAALGAPNH